MTIRRVLVVICVVAGCDAGSGNNNGNSNLNVNGESDMAGFGPVDTVADLGGRNTQPTPPPNPSSPPPSCCVTPVGYTTTAVSGLSLPQRPTLNLAGAGVSCVDNAGSARTDCTFNNLLLSPGAPQVGTASLHNTSYAGGDLTLTLGNVGGNIGYGILAMMQPNDPNGAATWYDTVTSGAFYGSINDWVRDIGWNLASNGTRVDTKDAAIGDQWESHYDADATHSWVERHVVFIGSDGKYQRPLTIQVARTAGANPIGYTSFGLASDVLWMSGSATGAAQNFVFLNPTSDAPGHLEVANNSQIRLMNNGQPQLVQSNAAGTGTYQLATVGGDNKVHLGDAATATVLDGSSLWYDAGPANYVLIGGSTNPTNIAPVIDSPTMYMRGMYWTGSSTAANDVAITHVQDSATPTSHLRVMINNVNLWDLTSGGAVSQKVGGAIAAAKTIAPTAAITHITGTTTFSTITPPEAFVTPGMGGCIKLIFDGVAAWNTSGNIAVPGTPTTAKTMVEFCYDHTTAQWYPSRTQ